MPLLNCNAQEGDITFNQKTNKFELSLQAGIDQSAIASEWIRLVDEVKKKDSIIEAKSKTIKKISDVANNRLNEISSLTNLILEQNKKISKLSDNRVNIVKKTKSIFNVVVEANLNPVSLSNIEFVTRGVLDFRKIYLYGEGSLIINQSSRFDVGVGINIF